MAITDQTTSIQDFEGGPTYTSVGGGAGAADDTSIIIESATSGGRLASNKSTLFGFTVAFTSVDLSAAGEHVKAWVFLTHYAVVTSIVIRLSDGTNDDDHTFPTADYPVLGGWVPVWIDISRAPETGGSMNEAAVTDAGLLVLIPAVTGTSRNILLDEIAHTTAGLLWDGASGSFADFRSHDSTNASGIFINNNGIDFLYARLTIGSATATGFVDSGFTIIAPDQALIAATFMGLTIDLQHASTAITLTGGVYSSGNPSGATNKPDLVVSGTSGAFDWDLGVLAGIRTIVLNAQCSLTNAAISDSGLVDAGSGADLSGSSILSSSVAADDSALLWNVNLDPNGELDNMTFSKGAAAHHAIEFGTTSPLSMTLTGITFSGFNASDAQNDSTIYVKRTTGTVNITIAGGGSTPSVKTDGATVNIIAGAVSATVTVLDLRDASAIEGAYVLVKASDGTGPFPFEESVTIVQAAGTATVTHTAHGMATNDKVVIIGANETGYDGVHIITVTGANTYTYPVPSGTTSPATGTITSTYAALAGLTDASGVITMSRVFSTDQPVSGEARKKSHSPSFIDGPIVGIIDSADGLSSAVQLVFDE